MNKYMFKLIPSSIKNKYLYSKYYRNKEAMCLASSSKRIDICSAQFAHLLHLSKQSSLEGKVCLEIGSGWVLSHAIVCYLLGARKVIATDITPIAYPSALSFAFKNAIHSIPRDILAPFSDHSLIRKRYNRLLSISKFDFKILKEFGIEYISPIDLTSEKLNINVDFIYSQSVLEHVPINDISKLLKNLASILNPCGTMIHCIHLEDHINISENPFNFLSISKNNFTSVAQSIRGNRIRASEWSDIFNNISDIKTKFIYNYLRKDKLLPKVIDSSISYNNENDLRISHIGVYSKKIL